MTNDEKAQYYDQWKDYFEPLARVYRGVKQAEPHWRGMVGGIASALISDKEVRTELENLIQTMLNEVESDE